MRLRFAAMSCVAATALAAASALHAAELKAQVLDTSGQPIKDAIVYAVPDKPSARPARNAVIDQVNRRFVPRVSVIQTGASVELPNSDNVRHSVYSFSTPNRFTLKLYAGKPAAPVTFPKPGIVVLGCNIHDSMVAYILVVDTPFFARTDAGGHATLADLEPGNYTLKAWRASMSAEQTGQPLVVGAGALNPVSLRVPVGNDDHDDMAGMSDGIPH